jgi:PII-like signaling protein
MNGYQLTFFTQQTHRHRGGRPLGHWLVEQARALGIHGATLIAATEGFGHRGRIHSAHFVDLADQPVEVVMAVTQEELDRLFKLLRDEKVKIVYVKAPVEFGTLGNDE